MDDLIKDTIKKIKEQNIKPEPRWKYLARKYSFWILFFLLVLFGSAALAVSTHLISDLDWDLYRFQHHNVFWFFFSIAPIFWLIAILMLAIAAYFDILKSEKGYKYGITKILGVVIFAVAGFGLIFSKAGLGKKLNSSLERNIPAYSKIVITKEAQWSRPDQGFLAGTIKERNENIIDLQDLTGQNWNIETNTETNVRPSVDLRLGEKIKVIGEEQGSQNFKAEEIRPWVGKGRGNSGDSGQQDHKGPEFGGNERK